MIRLEGRIRTAALVWGLSTALALVGRQGALADCAPATVSNDTTSWNTVRATFLGKALGQTFYASDTLITRITVWRPPNNRNIVATRLFVTTVVDTPLYEQPMPLTANILQDGPMVFVFDSDPPGLPIQMDFVLDPPLALPRPGLYAFFIQREDCDAGETMLLAKEPGSYGPGTYWLTGQTAFLPCFLRDVELWEDLDLCFEIEFCRDESTPVRRESWGQLKVTYR